MKLSSVAISSMYVWMDFSTYTFFGVFYVDWDMPAVTFRIAFYLDEICVDEPCVRIVVVESVNKIENLPPNQRIIPINIHNNIPSPTKMPRSRIPIPKCPNLPLIPQYRNPIIQSRIFYQLLQYNLRTIITRCIINHIHMIITIILLIDRSQKYMKWPVCSTVF